MNLSTPYNSYILFSLMILIANNIHLSTTFNLTIIHDNDLHSFFAPITISLQEECKPSPSQACYGGFARFVTKVKELRSQNPNNLYLNAGDYFFTTVAYTLFKWEVVAKFVKLLKPDAFALGNHEFDDGLEGLVPFINSVAVNNTNGNIPILSCNINISQLNSIVKPSIVLEVSGRQIAIIGYITPGTKGLDYRVRNEIFNDEIISIKNEINRLKAIYGSSLNIFIALGHSGIDKDKQIAQQIPDLDIVVGGHSHSFLYTGLPLPSTDNPVDNYPVVINHGVNGTTLIVQAFCYSKYLGLISAVFDDNGNIVSYAGKPILMDSSIAEDNYTKSEVNNLYVEIQNSVGYFIGKTNIKLDYNCRPQECNLGNVVADSFVYYFKTIYNISVPIGIVIGGRIRSNINVGNITKRDTLRALPFGNTIGILRTTGSTLWNILKTSGDRQNNLGFLQVSGLKVVYNLTRPIGNRLISVQVRCETCLPTQFENLDISKNYTIGTTDNLAGGGDGFTFINQQEYTPYYVLEYDALSYYIQTNSPITTGIEGRIKLI